MQINNFLSSTVLALLTTTINAIPTPGGTSGSTATGGQANLPDLTDAQLSYIAGARAHGTPGYNVVPGAQGASVGHWGQDNFNHYAIHMLNGHGDCKGFWDNLTGLKAAVCSTASSTQCSVNNGEIVATFGAPSICTDSVVGEKAIYPSTGQTGISCTEPTAFEISLMETAQANGQVAQNSAPAEWK